MFRKSMIAFAAITALSTTALVSADAFAKPNGGGWGKGGRHGRLASQPLRRALWLLRLR
jgi:hypothetical protein